MLRIPTHSAHTQMQLDPQEFGHIRDPGSQDDQDQRKDRFQSEAGSQSTPEIT